MTREIALAPRNPCAIPDFQVPKVPVKFTRARTAGLVRLSWRVTGQFVADDMVYIDCSGGLRLADSVGDACRLKIMDGEVGEPKSSWLCGDRRSGRDSGGALGSRRRASGRPTGCSSSGSLSGAG
jgi:hypothetical protein